MPRATNIYLLGDSTEFNKLVSFFTSRAWKCCCYRCNEYWAFSLKLDLQMLSGRNVPLLIRVSEAVS